MDAFLVSTSSLLFAEFGDKTQLMAFVLAVRFGRPTTVMAAILLATASLNGMAVAVGSILGDLLSPAVLRWGLGLSFLAAAAWALGTNDNAESEIAPTSRFGAFASTFVAFSVAELGRQDAVRYGGAGDEVRLDAGRPWKHARYVARDPARRRLPSVLQDGPPDLRAVGDGRAVRRDRRRHPERLALSRSDGLNAVLRSVATPEHGIFEERG